MYNNYVAGVVNRDSVICIYIEMLFLAGALLLSRNPGA